MANMGDNNSDFSTRNKTSNSRVMCFIIVSTIALMIINNMYINNYTWPTLNKVLFWFYLLLKFYNALYVKSNLTGIYLFFF